MSERPTAPLIAAKQTVPPIRPGTVVRTRLRAGLHRDDGTRLTVVVAPAGWGKTTLLSQWAHDAAETRGVVWVSLDEADDDPIRFWTYVLTALHRAAPELADGALGALSTPGLDPVDLALPLLLNALVELDRRYVLVLDDYHVLSDPRVHEGVEFLLAYLPPTLHLVLAGRSDPPLPLARLRARRELTEIRAADLGFRPDEAAALLCAVGDAAFDAEAVTALCARTEGWAAGLQLAALTVRGAADPATAATTIRGDDRHVLDYLSTEVLDRLETDHRDLLVRTSVLERLTGPLCDHVLGRDGSAEVLRALERADLFVVPLDARGDWYRCHGLFRDVLRRELTRMDPAEPARVLARAADWFLAREHLVDAVDHRLRAGDEPAAADLLRSSVPWFLERGALSTHLELGQRLSPGTVLADPRLCVALAWAAALDGRHDRMGPWLDAAEDLIDEDTPALEGWRTVRGAAATMRAVELVIWRAEAEPALTASAHAIAQETDPMVAGYVMARTVRGAVLAFSGRHEEAVPFLDEAWERARALGLSPLLALQPASILGVALTETGRVERLRRLLADVAPAVRTAEQQWGTATTPGVATLRTAEARLAGVDGDPGTARTLLLRAVELARTSGEAPALLTALTDLAEAELDRGDPAAARAALAQAREVGEHEPVLTLFVDRLARLERRAGRSAAPPRRHDEVVEDLTDRESAILRALTGDATQREIGASLYLSINTVKGYTKILYRKLGVSTRAEAVERARALGLVGSAGHAGRAAGAARRGPAAGR
ncbi:MAG: malT [Actinomycetospora sp.]|jgi:LuxR family maltose regulon positive regulatory protein|nr:malT [Actinomycetospora sp.]